jgi:hypothetical protein
MWIHHPTLQPVGEYPIPLPNEIIFDPPKSSEFSMMKPFQSKGYVHDEWISGELKVNLGDFHTIDEFGHYQKTVVLKVEKERIIKKWVEDRCSPRPIPLFPFCMNFLFLVSRPRLIYKRAHYLTYANSKGRPTYHSIRAGSGPFGPRPKMVAMAVLDP